jgi:hypothetical protein
VSVLVCDRGEVSCWLRLMADGKAGMVYTPMMYGKDGGMSQDVRENRKRRSLLGTEGSGKSSAKILNRENEC